MWTLVVCLALNCQAVEDTKVIVVDGFTKIEDCRYAGQTNIDFVNPHALYRCDKTNRPPEKCNIDTRSYGRSAECIK